MKLTHLIPIPGLFVSQNHTREIYYKSTNSDHIKIYCWPVIILKMQLGNNFEEKLNSKVTMLKDTHSVEKFKQREYKSETVK